MVAGTVAIAPGGAAEHQRSRHGGQRVSAGAGKHHDEQRFHEQGARCFERSNAGWTGVRWFSAAAEAWGDFQVSTTSRTATTKSAATVIKA